VKSAGHSAQWTLFMCVLKYAFYIVIMFTMVDEKRSYVNHKKGSSTFVIITLENLDGF